MMSRDYIQRIAERLVDKYRIEATVCPGHGPTERLLKAANALDGFVNRHVSFEHLELTAVLELAKDEGTAGHEMWLAGQAWIDQFSD